MNLPTKLTVLRIILAIVVMVLLMFPFEAVGISIPVIRTTIDMDLRYIIAGVIFLIASLTDFLDGYLARKNNQVTDTGKMLDAIADKMLVNPVLIIFSAEGLISPIVPVVVVARDIVVNTIKMEAASKGKVVAAIKSGKIKTASLMTGMVLLFFSNMPFELINIRVDLFLIYFATLMSLISMVQYYSLNKKIIFEK
ncbi:MAG TPA: CDP-diacylglycerol--glycerol-3-phosphate 3-phosphatidyltransferase [Candidatus Scybalousia intestinigallinarum]|nr:CDP-diacylglycerol--glycerol-3-phosphate 3-phosphatidyltransferase [Candidatus Scybalousia intestinigallinarum]